jgi:DNA invertase Pin-like site-specific DNA recombinase|nr:MAG TPA: integrase [Caudoviricetes sp.]
MSNAARITVIPPHISQMPSIAPKPILKKRVAAYARVSTDTEEQLTSYEAQVDYYTRYIQSKDEWNFVGIYTDEGISATSTKKREGFNRMIKDALDGHIDMIITKSVSRFARNTVDTLTTVRQLKEKGVEVYFEKENIYTLDSKGELLITIMSSLAQEESRSISENVTWGQRKRFADGKVSLPYKRFLGYKKGEDGLPKIVESEAKIVRMIYILFLEGKTTCGIAKLLTESFIPTPSGKQKWQTSTVASILQNEKYKGDALLQKKFTVDFLTKKQKVNEGEVPQYYVENSHPAIISSEVFDMVQEEMHRRRAQGRKYSGGSYLSSKIICGKCGGTFGSKVWHSTDKYRRTVWQCNNRFKSGCDTPHLSEEALKNAFVNVFNRLLQNKDKLLSEYETIIATITDNTDLDEESMALQGECDVVSELMRKCVEENAHTALNQIDYQQRYNTLVERFENARMRLKKINTERIKRAAKRAHINSFIETLEHSNRLLTDFDEDVWCAIIDKVIVEKNGRLIFQFKDGSNTEEILS